MLFASTEGINCAGVKWVIRLQLVLLLMLFIAVLDFTVGSFVHTDTGQFALFVFVFQHFVIVVHQHDTIFQIIVKCSVLYPQNFCVMCLSILF